MPTILEDHFRGRPNNTAAINELTGIMRGIMADGALNEREVLFLDTWLLNHESVCNTWPADIIRHTIKQIMADGIITQDELDHLSDVLAKAIGGTLESTGTPDGLSTTLPVEEIETLTWRDTHFCLTGGFIYGTRKACSAAIQQRGGIVQDGITRELNLLVIGSNASPSWFNTSHGRKIEKAVTYRDEGLPIKIISESTWARFL